MNLLIHRPAQRKLSSLIAAVTDRTRKALWQSILRRQLKLLLPAKPEFVSPRRGPATALLRVESLVRHSGPAINAEKQEKPHIISLSTFLAAGENQTVTIRECQ